MEPLRPEELITDLQRRLEDIVTLTNTPVIATLKERRQNSTTLLPIPDELRNFFPNLVSDQGYFTQNPPLIEELWLKLLEPFHSLGYLSVIPVLWLKPSLKSRQFQNSPHKLYLKSAVSRLQTPGAVVGLWDLANSLGYGQDLLQATSGSVETNEFFRAVNGVLSAEDPDLAGPLFDERFRTHTPTAELSVKFIPERGEVRAFTQDHCCLRSLVGSAVHSIMHPSNKTDRAKLFYASIWRIKDKNLISEEHSVPIRHTAAVIHGDVSSFTSSFSNIWIVLLGALYLVESQDSNLEDSTVILSWSGVLVEAKLSLILRLYIYLTFRMSVQDLVVGDVFQSKGGMLGVAGVNTTACVVFSVFLGVVCDHLRREHDLARMTPVVGGDDYRLWMQGGGEFGILQAWQRLTSLCEQYIGSLSENTIEFLPIRVRAVGSSYHLSKFCKKLTFVKWNTANDGLVKAQLQSQFSIPLFSLMLQDPEYVWSDKGQEQWATLSKVLYGQLPWIEERGELLSIMLRVFRLLFGPLAYHVYHPVIKTGSQWFETSEESVEATFLIDTYVSPLTFWGRVTIRNREDVVKLLLASSKLTTRDIETYGGFRTITITLKQSSLIKTSIRRTTEPALLPCDNYLVLNLYRQIVQTKLALDNYELRVGR